MRRLVKILLLIVLLVVTLQFGGCFSCKSYHAWKGTGRVPPLEIAEKAYWSEDCEAWAALKYKPVAAPVKPKAKPESKCGPSAVSRSYPCEGCGVIRLDKTMPKEVQLNAPFDYTIKVTNLTDMIVTDVEVTENLPENFKFTKASPTAEKEENELMWTMGELGPKASQLIRVHGVATSTDCLKHCATVTYIIPACANVEVVEAELKLVKTAPSEVLCARDPFVVKFIVTNTGTGAAEDVKVEDKLPPGLTTVDGKSTIMLNVGTLAAGQSKEFSASLKASKTGKYENKAVATSATGLKAEDSTTTVVRQPILAITKTGPEKRYLGRSITYEITVTNKGDAPAKELVVEDQLPAGVKFVSASDGGGVAAGKVRWNLGTLMPDRSRSVSVTVMPERADTLNNVAAAMAKCADGVRASAKTTISGISAVLLEVIDIEDPIELGNNETYVITATNQGSSADNNIKIVCTLEDTQQYVSSSGATRASVAGNSVIFEPLSTLAPQAKATWRVTVKAVKTGDVRFTVVMNTNQLTRPVQETEATNQYE